MKRIIILCLLVGCLLFSCRENRHIEYYKSGSISFEVPIKKGFYEGTSFEYYENGSIKRKADFLKGEIIDSMIYYYTDGKKQSSAFYKNGLMLGEHIIYYPNGRIHEKKYYDEKGRMVDYFKYDEKGELFPDYRSPLFISNKNKETLSSIDTLFLGEMYEARIRLGNRFYQKISVHIIGESKDSTNSEFNSANELTLYTDSITRIPNIDDLTCLYKFKPVSKGEQYIYGVIYDLYEKGDSITFSPIKFRHKIHVR